MSPHQRITALEADVAKLQWQVAQLIEQAKTRQAERDAFTRRVFAGHGLALPYQPTETQADFQHRVMNKPYSE